MVKIYNSNKIIKSVKKNKPKFDVLKSISEEILQIREEKQQQKRFVIKAYNVVLKNIANSKKEIADTSYVVSKSGISKKTNYAQNADNIVGKTGFFECLIEVKKDLPNFLKVLSPSKRPRLKRFVEKVHLLKESPPFSMTMMTKIEWVDKDKNIDMLRVNYKYGLIDGLIGITFGTDDWHSDKIKTINLDFQDYAIIEQLYIQIKKVLEMELKQNTKELNNMKKYLADIDKKFATYIKSVETLNELNKGD